MYYYVAIKYHQQKNIDVLSNVETNVKENEMKHRDYFSDIHTLGRLIYLTCIECIELWPAQDTGI